MDNQCPICSQQFQDTEQLKLHLEKAHRVPQAAIPRVIKAGGWYEQQQMNREGELVAPDHQMVALKAQLQKEPKPLSVPIVMKEEKKEPTIAAGWRKTTEGYQFEETLFEKNTAENVIKKVLRAKLTPNHGQALLYIYDKNITELSEAQEKAGILDARMTGLVPSDPKFVVLAESLHDSLYQVRTLKKNLQPEVHTEIALESFYHGTFNSDEHAKWQQSFMEKVLVKAAELKKICEDMGKEDEK